MRSSISLGCALMLVSSTAFAGSYKLQVLPSSPATKAAPTYAVPKGNAAASPAAMARQPQVLTKQQSLTNVKPLVGQDGGTFATKSSLINPGNGTPNKLISPGNGTPNKLINPGNGTPNKFGVGAKGF